MNHDITRPILWNVPVPFIIFLYAMLIPLTAAFVYAALRWYRIVSLCTPTPDSRVDQLGRRLFLALRDGAGNGFVGRETWGWMHYTFIVAFIGLFIGTSIDPGPVPSGRPMVFSACGRTASHFDSRRRRLHRRRVPEAAGFFGFPYYLVGMMEVL